MRNNSGNFFCCCSPLLLLCFEAVDDGRFFFYILWIVATFFAFYFMFFNSFFCCCCTLGVSTIKTGNFIAVVVVGWVDHWTLKGGLRDDVFGGEKKWWKKNSLALQFLVMLIKRPFWTEDLPGDQSFLFN